MTNWYVRLNRDRLKDGEDKDTAMSVLFEVIFNFTLMMCPFTPFFAEFCYQTLKPGLTEGAPDFVDSVHYLMLPTGDDNLIKEDVERKVGYMQSAIRIARFVRDKKKIPVRKPLASLTLICSAEIQQQIQDLLPYISMDVHVLEIQFETEEKKFIKFTALPDGRVLGKKYGKEFAAIKAALTKLDYNIMANVYEQTLLVQQRRNAGEEVEAPTFECLGKVLSSDEVTMTRELVVPDQKKYFGSVDGEMAAFCDIEDSPLINEILVAREIRNRIQKARKDLGLKPTDKVDIYLDLPEGDNEIRKVLASENPKVTGALGLNVQIGAHEGEVVESNVNGINFKVILFRK
jgi:isoleucyl-tRNA synthetase